METTKRRCDGGVRRASLTATDLTALMSFLLSRFFRILLISVRGRLLLKRMSLLQIPGGPGNATQRNATHKEEEEELK